MRALRDIGLAAALLVLGFTVGYLLFTVFASVFGVPDPMNDLMAYAINFFHTYIFHV